MSKKAIEEQLLQEKKEIVGEIESMESWGMKDSIKESVSELSTYDNHPADVSDLEELRSKDMTLCHHLREHGRKIDQALQRLAKDEYGICQNCGQKIDSARLNALPDAAYCLHCQLAREGSV